MRELIFGELAIVSGGSQIISPLETYVDDNWYKLFVGTTRPSGQNGISITVSGRFGDIESGANGFGTAMERIGNQQVEAGQMIF